MTTKAHEYFRLKKWIAAIHQKAYIYANFVALH